MKIFTLSITEENGNVKIKSENDGFNCFELLGIIECKKHDFVKQIIGEVKPEIKRSCVVREEV